MGLSDLAYATYERRILRGLDRDRLPCHVGAIVDGNRRWAKDARMDLEQGYAAGAAKVDEFLEWCHELGVGTVTFWVLSTDNLQRPGRELASILDAVEALVGRLADDGRWQLRLIGNLELLPQDSADRLQRAAEATPCDDGLLQVNVCVGYGGRQELTDAMRSLLRAESRKGRTLEEVASTLVVDDIAEHLYTKGQPDPDLVIRTSGEQRLSGFLLWQSVHSEFYFSDVLWPAFRRVDLLRAMRSYAARERRFGA
ncbi:polyprenyl diphosphate synthase [Aeromicrobium halocynthiae]|uniref:Isoprenyl transferase n=1 Tax=Aeromicrobium halocynthiae TaxID=560557 RepID=A0ABN2W7M6_9ACTN